MSKRTYNTWTQEDDAILYNSVTELINLGQRVDDSILFTQQTHFPERTLTAVRLNYYKIKSSFEESEPVAESVPNIMGVSLPKPVADLVTYVTNLEMENADLKESLKELDELRGIKDEWEKLMVIMGKAREMAVGESQKSKFKMDANGNLERMD